MDSIADHRVDGSHLDLRRATITSKNVAKRYVETTKGWELLIQWKDGSTSWEALKDVKARYPVQLAEYSVQKKISS